LIGEAFDRGRPAAITPLLVPVLFGFLVGFALCALRVYQRSLAWRSKGGGGLRSRTLVVGAGDAGEATVRELARLPNGDHEIIGLVDDNPEKAHLLIHGRPVLGTIDELPRLVVDHSIDEVLVAMPSARGEVIRRVYELCAPSEARVRTLPSVAAVASAPESISRQFREIEIEDLLRRAPIHTDLRKIAGYLSGEHVMITGGGGSIGSELARQIARLSPASIILVGKGENSVYEIEQELIQAAGMTPIAVVADVRDTVAMERVYAEYRPTVVFHAAAHKHVPLMQRNPYEAIRNNVLGTLNVGELALRYGVKKFILISTDKAVKPSSVMGATKRICEKIVAALAIRGDTEFAAVRFGNVLGSRGSLIPLLKAQIKRGGPVRITHQEMTRFFMTIPEAVQLVVQAGALGSRGEVFVLDMGEPVRINDLALDLVRMHGLRPGVDIGVQYTGMRPGEKLHEELLYDAEDLVASSHPK
ncbi:polysaccharide biosynthesis protein, partial [bacterium]